MRPAFPNPLSAVPQIKVCGLTRLSDALVCAENGIDAIGINFWPKSKRFHALADASQWLEQLPESLTRVAVFVNAPVEEVREIMSSGLIDVAQFHGDETDDYVSRFLDTGIPVIRALSARSEADLEKISRSPVRSILLDAFQPGVYGGTGQTCDWELAARAVKAFPDKHIILSGGLTALNSAQAIREVHPAAIDLASGVESVPGIKDAEMIRLLANAVRSATSNPPLPHP